MPSPRNVSRPLRRVATRTKYSRLMWRLLLIAVLGLPACAKDPVTVSLPPTAFAGFDGSAKVGQEVSLDGSQSIDPDGDPLAFHWTMVVRPDSSATHLTQTDERLTRFVADVPGTYVVSLTVSDGAFEARDVVGIVATETTTAAEPLSLSLSPAVCNLAFSPTLQGPCADREAVVLTVGNLSAPQTRPEDLTMQWSFVRLPPGISTADLQANFPTSPDEALRFMPPRPGAYWVSARVLGNRSVSPPTIAAVQVLSSPDDLDGLPQAQIEGPRSARVRERVILDGRASQTATPAAQYRWSLLTDPSRGTTSLVDRATGCPPGVCRRFTPAVRGTYVVRLDVGTDTATGAPALWTIEVEP
jgi:hypothetical protein